MHITDQNMITINEQDLSDPALLIYHTLSEPQLLHYYEPGPGIFIAESLKVACRALRAGYEPLSLVLEDRIAQEAADIAASAAAPSSGCADEQIGTLLAGCGNIPVYTAPASVLSRITGYRLTGGVLCAMKRRPLPKPEEICADARRIAVLERVTNPTNVGAIFRSAAALSYDAVLLTEDCCDPLYRRSSRVSMGTVFQIPWTYLPASEGITLPERLRELGFRSAAMALCEDAVPIDAPQLHGIPRLAVLLGSEGDGLREETIRSSDHRVIIPMAEGVDSLNVAAASAVAFWELSDRHPARV